MHFVHPETNPGDTIAAITTPPGEGGVALIRVSGDNALTVADQLFSGDVTRYASHTVHYGYVLNEHGARIDDVLLTVLHAPKTYTGEDTVEISCHGGSLVTQHVLQRVLNCGARHALAGEFTYKAFLNGKLDLAQAEAVQTLISAKNEAALSAASDQLQGVLSQKITGFQKRLTHLVAVIEAWIDFPEEGLEFITMEKLLQQLEEILREMQQLAATYHRGRLLHEGIQLALVGRPNVGKSSLLNALVGEERAIVTAEAGTTRDVVEVDIRHDQMHFRLIDTAGMRETPEAIEAEGVRRARHAAERADVVVMVIDAAEGMNRDEQEILSLLADEKVVVAANKVDLTAGAVPMQLQHPLVAVSAKERLGLEELLTAAQQRIVGNERVEGVRLSNARHKEALESSIKALERIVQGLREGVSPEFLSLDCRDTLRQLGKILGTNVTEDILTDIFAHFCIGK